MTKGEGRWQKKENTHVVHEREIMWGMGAEREDGTEHRYLQ